MAEFINTIESLGDEEFVKRFIERTVTAYFDDSIENIGFAAFQSNSLLTEVNLPAVKSIASAAFRACSALKRVDLSACTSITGVAPFGNSALETFILRTPSVCQCDSTSTFLSTPITSGTGYIYVPAALVDSYKAASGWSTYASQIRAIEDYPEVCDPYSWVAVSKAIENGTYKDVYKIGDEVPVDLGSEGIINMQIAAFDTDVLADGSGTAAISWVAKELLATSHRWNPVHATNDDGTSKEGTGAIGGFYKSELKQYLDTTIKPLIPEQVRELISPVTVNDYVYSAAYVGAQIEGEVELWVPAYADVKGADAGGKFADLFPDEAARIKHKIGETTATRWWLRTANNHNSPHYVKQGGGVTGDFAQYEHGVCLGFCTGRTPTA